MFGLQCCASCSMRVFSVKTDWWGVPAFNLWLASGFCPVSMSRQIFRNPAGTISVWKLQVHNFAWKGRNWKFGKQRCSHPHSLPHWVCSVSNPSLICHTPFAWPFSEWKQITNYLVFFVSSRRYILYFRTLQLSYCAGGELLFKQSVTLPVGMWMSSASNTELKTLVWAEIFFVC